MSLAGNTISGGGDPVLRGTGRGFSSCCATLDSAFSPLTPSIGDSQEPALVERSDPSALCWAMDGSRIRLSARVTGCPASSRIEYHGVPHMRFALTSIEQDSSSFGTLARLYTEMKNCIFETIEVDMRRTTWFDADMCAVLGAILYKLSIVNDIELTNIHPSVRSILSKNGFLSHYGHERIPDHWSTTITYHRFNLEDGRYFFDFINNKFVRRNEMPAMSDGLLRKFREGIFEIFSNSVLHSKTELGIFACGQFYPTRQRLRFTIADLGIGIRDNIYQETGKLMEPEYAIAWATEVGNTTKTGNIPGGLGLDLLCKFIDLNNGCIRIISDAGYWCMNQNQVELKKLSHAFPGTVVSVEINTSDQRSYRLSDDIDMRDLF